VAPPATQGVAGDQLAPPRQQDHFFRKFLRKQPGAPRTYSTLDDHVEICLNVDFDALYDKALEKYQAREKGQPVSAA
jgi:hypothetical protein